MITVIIATHGKLASALLDIAKQATGSAPEVVTVEMNNEAEFSPFEQSFRAVVERLQIIAPIVILTDMFGGLPSNIAMTWHRQDRIEIITGVNLAMVIKALQVCSKEADLSKAVKQIADAGARSITVASSFLEKTSRASHGGS